MRLIDSGGNDDMMHHRPFSNMSRQMVTLSALEETYPAESNTAVLKQRSYTGERLVIPSALANISCEYLGVEGVLETLNTTLGTAYRLDLKLSSILGSLLKVLHSILESYIS